MRSVRPTITQLLPLRDPEQQRQRRKPAKRRFNSK
jgi:hypothetical protein